MKIKLYRTNDSDNVINKQLEMIYEFNIRLKSDVDIVNPVIILNDKNKMNFNECNYCYLEDFNRYYFIRSIENRNNNLWALYLECDVLESFKDDILTSTAKITRNLRENEYIQTSLNVEVRKEIDIYKSDVELEKKPEIILSTISEV